MSELTIKSLNFNTFYRCQILDPKNCEEAVVLLVCDRAGVPEHCMCRIGTLWPAEVAHHFFM